MKYKFVIIMRGNPVKTMLVSGLMSSGLSSICGSLSFALLAMAPTDSVGDTSMLVLLDGGWLDVDWEKDCTDPLHLGFLIS